MASLCPQCGTHLGGVRAQDGSDTTTSTASGPPQPDDSRQREEAPRSLKPAQPHHLADPISPKEDATDRDKEDQRRIKLLICLCPCFGFGVFQSWFSFRIYLCSERTVGVLQDGRPAEVFERAATKMLATIHHAGEGSPDRLLISRPLGRISLKKCWFPAERVFQFIGAIAYDMEWTSWDGELEFEKAAALADATNTIGPRFRMPYDSVNFLRHMLLVDYGVPASPIFSSKDWYLPDEVVNAMWSFERFCGFASATAWRWRQGQSVPDQRAWDLILDVLQGCTAWPNIYYTWDAAVMFYYYYSRRKPVSPQARREGWTGYTGVLQEMIAEVPTRGRDRLQRKPSLDHHIISIFIKDKTLSNQMMDMVLDLATEHGLEVVPPTKAAPETPAPDTSSRRGWIASLFGFVPSRIKLEDEEKGATKTVGKEGP